MRNALFNYSNYNYQPSSPSPSMVPIANSNLSYSADFDSPKMRRAFTLPAVDVRNFESMPELDSYRHDDTIIVPEDTIVSTPGVIPQRHQQQRWEVNLRPNVKDVIATTAGISPPDPHNQSALFADTRLSIDSSRYKAGEDPKAIESHFDSNNGVASRAGNAILKSDRPPSQQQHHPGEGEGSNETQGPTRSCSLERDTTTLSQGSGVSLPPEERSYPHDVESEPFTLDKLHPINRDEALGKLLAKLYDKGIKENGDGNGGEKSSEKSQARCAIEGKNMSVIKGEIMDAMESQLTSAQMAEKVKDDNMSSGKDTINVAGTLSHAGRAEKTPADYFPNNIKKKEKLSIETIENAIYGERITPTTSLPDRMLNLEKLGQAFSENLKIDSVGDSAEINSREEKSEAKVRNEMEEFESKYGGENENEGDVEQPTGSFTEEDANQQSSEVYNQNQIDHDPELAVEGNYDTQGHEFQNYENVDYQNDTKTLDTSQYGFEGQQATYSDYNYQQSQDQQQGYDQLQTAEQVYYQTNDQNYGAQGEANYDTVSDMQYPSYPDTNYTVNQEQYESYNQNYENSYPVGEYSQNSEGQNTLDQTQMPPVEAGYGYDPQEPANEVDYDSNTQQYSNPQYEEQQYSEVPQEYYQYDENGQFIADSYVPQRNEYPADTDAPNSEAVIPAEGVLEASEQISENDLNPPQSFDEKPSPAAAIAPQEDSIQEAAPEQLEPVKPASILATSDKAYESSPASSNKNKKKKRVIFADNETEESSSKVAHTPTKDVNSVSRPVAAGGASTATK
ncbi:uncharacterized protein LOC119651639 isoform X2 [Hermetia illucens]|nr:uncharacterized protein LOC119651639 isoform X2 [Hermetia illucens]XP_037911239.1 uncharacterized protein LOC119651639 isoform X2 [Hermetia illucens]XP_037911240.1 uncharacterized protein LOC119651639 isoform X2 [Hermetia illucens]